MLGFSLLMLVDVSYRLWERQDARGSNSDFEVRMQSHMKESGAAMNIAVKRSTPITVASFLFLLFGLGFAIAIPLNLTYIIYRGSGPVYPVIGGVMDSTTLIWVTWGLNGVIVLGIFQVALAAIGVAAGFLLWRSSKKGGRLGIVLVPFDLFFALGFGIPILYVVAPLKALLLGMGWRSLR